ncbi:hypothetical protein EMIT048CA2_160143 [Pseudomonas chlororaphis]
MSLSCDLTLVRYLLYRPKEHCGSKSTLNQHGGAGRGRAVGYEDKFIELRVYVTWDGLEWDLSIF